jgi:hypothetical protein
MRPTFVALLAVLAATPSPSAFFLKVVDAQITFVRDAAGTVTQLVLHQNGQDLPGRKIK